VLSGGKSLYSTLKICFPEKTAEKSRPKKVGKKGGKKRQQKCGKKGGKKVYS